MDFRTWTSQHDVGFLAVAGIKKRKAAARRKDTMSYPPYQYQDLGDGKTPIVKDASYDSIREIARKFGEVKIPDTCVGCTEYPYTFECELCQHYATPDPTYKVERQATIIIRAMQNIISAERIRTYRGLEVNSMSFQKSIKQLMSDFLDAGDKLFDATDTSSVTLDVKSPSLFRRFISWIWR